MPDANSRAQFWPPCWLHATSQVCTCPRQTLTVHAINQQHLLLSLSLSSLLLHYPSNLSSLSSSIASLVLHFQQTTGRSIVAKKDTTEGSQIKESTDSSQTTVEDEEAKGRLACNAATSLLHRHTLPDLILCSAQCARYILDFACRLNECSLYGVRVCLALVCFDCILSFILVRLFFLLLSSFTGTQSSAISFVVTLYLTHSLTQ